MRVMSKFDEKEIVRRLELISRIEPTLEAADRAMERVRNILIDTNKQEGREGSNTTVWRTIVQSKITRFAAAAVIIVAVLIGADLLIRPGEELTIPDTRVEAEKKQIDAMAAADDVDGLVVMLSEGQFESKVLAAEYLGKIGDERALPELERLYLLAEEQLPEGHEDNPFAEPIETIKSRIEPEHGESVGVTEPNTITVVDVTEGAPAETNEPVETNEKEITAVNVPAETPGVVDFKVVSDKTSEGVTVSDANETTVVDVTEGTPAETNEPVEINETEIAAVNVPTETPTVMDFYVVHKKTGEPLPGVHLNIKIQREGPDDVNELVTDEQGLCKIDFGDLRTKYILIKVHKDHFVPADIRIRKAEDKAHITIPRSYTLALEPGTSIGGFVRNVRRGPIAAAAVYLRASGGPTTPRFWIWDYEEKTDANGFWQCDIMPAKFDGLSIRLAHPNYIDDESYNARTTPPIRELRDMNSVMVMNEGVNLVGTVVDCNGLPIAKAGVRQGQENTWGIIYPRTETDDQGKFEFRNTRAGRVMLTVQAKGYAPQLRDISVRYGMLPVEFQLGPAQTIRGRVVDAADKPMEGVQVSLESWHHRHTIKWETKTDAEGCFEWNEAPKDETLFAFSRKGYRPIRFLELSPEVDEHIIVMDPALKVSGKVVDADTNEPISEFKLIIGDRPKQRQDSLISWERESARTFTGGRYELEFDGRDLYFSRNSCYFVRVEADGYVPGISSRSFTQEQEDVVIDLALEKGQGPSGIVYLPNGEPAAGARVALSTPSRGVFIDEGRLEDDKRWQSVTTGADGRFSFWPQTEKYLVVVAHDEGYAEVTDEELAAEPNIVLESWGRLEGVLSVAGRPLFHESMHLDYYDDYQQGVPSVSVHCNGARTDANGCFAWDRLVPGKVRISYMFPMTSMMVTRTRQQMVEILPGETTNVTIGGAGRAVIGSFVALPYEPIAWHKGQVSLDLELPEPPHPNDFEEMIFVERRSWNDHWRDKTEQGRLYKKMEWEQGRSYRAKIEPDGTFRVDGVPPGEYELRACVGAKLGGKAMWGPRKPVPPPDCEFVVPDVNERDANEPLDLGVIKVWQKKSPRIGDKAAVFEAETFEGERTNLLAFRGKVVLLTFWKCEPSILSELDSVLELCSSFKGNERFVALGMSLDRDVEAAKKFAKDNELKWINCFPAPGTRVEVSDDYEIWKFPMTFLIGPYGKILAIDPNPLRFKSTVEKVLGVEQ